jgi:hypothetical protein
VKCCAGIKATRKRDSNLLANREIFEDIGHGKAAPKQDSANARTDVTSILRVKAPEWAVLSSSSIFERVGRSGLLDPQTRGELALRLLLIRPQSIDTPCPIFAPFFWRKGGKPMHFFWAGSIREDD